MDAVQRVVIIFPRSTATQQIQLQQVERIDIRKAELNGFTKGGIVLKQLLLTRQGKDGVAGDVPFRGNTVENAICQFLVLDEIGITPRDLQVRFRQDHFE